MKTKKLLALLLTGDGIKNPRRGEARRGGEKPITGLRFPLSAESSDRFA
ncbi:MAG: hypothetical protein ILP09_05370 [Oscillospiraceae bacterium]|nr:hypothetical protein [Oscillospiraceae bacterium]